ncbi:non-classical arabinogalactan protein 30-like [Magnolia sinica]|uniref:non-classical arabinogalactan protein 30-like n=1 Tax=Magnolia sinica TaxID=86752 RepID=UPI0026590CA2|nr:non-classical arabinogalactan protein 30-like [Magnolia sinica]
MAFSRASFINGLLALQICVVLMLGSLDSTTSFGPVTWTKPTPPTPPMPPTHQIAVEGVVLCKSCKFRKMDPIPESVVRLQCRTRRHPTVVEGKTDKNGYFFIQPPKEVTTFSARRCKVFLISSPWAYCKLPTDLNGGVSGASLSFRTKLSGPNPIALFSVGPLAFAPNKTSCPFSP